MRTLASVYDELLTATDTMDARHIMEDHEAIMRKKYLVLSEVH